MIEEALVTLLTDAGVASGRIFPIRLPLKATLPAVTYMKVSGPRDQTHQGPSGLVPARFQVSSWGVGANGYDDAKQLSRLVRLALDGYRGTVGDVRIDGIELLNETDGLEPEPEAYQVILDFRVKHAEELG